MHLPMDILARVSAGVAGAALLRAAYLVRVQARAAGRGDVATVLRGWVARVAGALAILFALGCVGLMWFGLPHS